jgi:hypothetical protein
MLWYIHTTWYIHTRYLKLYPSQWFDLLYDISISNSKHVCTAETLLLRRQLLLFQLLVACKICISNNRLLSIPIYETNPERRTKSSPISLLQQVMIFQGTGQFYPNIAQISTELFSIAHYNRCYNMIRLMNLFYIRFAIYNNSWVVNKD